MKVKISDKQYAMIEKIARTKVGLNPQWWNNNEVVDTDYSRERCEECVVTNLNGLIREAMVAKYLDNVGIAYDWWIPFASGNLVDRVSEFHISKHKIDVKPIVDIKYIENGEPMEDGKINVDTLMQGLALDATQSYFRNKIDDIYIGVYLKDSLNGDIRGFQYRDSNKWRRYLREHNVSNEPKFNTAMCCPVVDLRPMNSFKDIDDIIFNKRPTSHRFINADRNPVLPISYTCFDKVDEYDMVFIEEWAKEWKLVWDDGVFTRNGKIDARKKVSKESVKRKLSEENGTKKKLNDEYENVKRKLKEEDRNRKLNNEYASVKRMLIEENESIKIGKMEHGNMEKIDSIDVLGITNVIVARSEKWKELTDNIKTLSDKKDEKTKRKEAIESELRDIERELCELSTKIDDCKKESAKIEDSFRLIGQLERKVGEKN